MKLTKISRILGATAISTIASATVFADNYDYEYNTGWYLGGNIGQSRSHVDNDGIAKAVLGNGFTITSLSDDDRETGYKAFAGYQFNKNFAVEGGYYDLGDFTFDVNTLPLGTLHGKVKFRGINVDAIGFLPINERLSAFARIGATYGETKNSYDGTLAAAIADGTHRERNTNIKAGLGLQYALNDQIDVRLEAERYHLNNGIGNNKDNVDLLSVGVLYRFGEKVHNAPPPKPVEPVRAPVAVEPPPPAPAPAPKFKKYTLSATELFAFNSDKVNTPQPKLIEIADALKQSDAPKHIVITGYSDRLGSKEYNQKLSERRAVAVKNYITSRGIDAERLKTEGKGEADPVVTCDDKNKAALIECLKPNRRVEIDDITVKVPVNK